MKKFHIIWWDCTYSVVRGTNIGGAFLRSGYGAVDFCKVKSYIEVDEKSNLKKSSN